MYDRALICCGISLTKSAKTCLQKSADVPVDAERASITIEGDVDIFNEGLLVT